MLVCADDLCSSTLAHVATVRLLMLGLHMPAKRLTCQVLPCLQDDTTAFVQLTARIPSQQAFAAYDARGKLIQGDPDKAVPVDDVWVFERTLRDDISSRQVRSLKVVVVTAAELLRMSCLPVLLAAPAWHC